MLCLVVMIDDLVKQYCSTSLPFGLNQRQVKAGDVRPGQYR